MQSFSSFTRSAVAGACLLTCALGAQAFPIGTDNPDLSMRWDNTVRYNLGVRVDKQDEAILNSSSYDDSDAKFKRGSIVMDRVDLLSELDVVYRQRFGARLSAAAWYDQAYHDSSVKTGPLFDTPIGNLSSAYPDNEYTHYTRRWNRGLSGEFLDAFVFAGTDIAGMPLNVRVGQYTLYWGESLFSFVHGVSYGQGPIDIRKALSNPGVEAKEVFKPLPQISATFQVNEQLSFAGQYFLDWRPSVFPDGGTYFGVLDPISGGGGTWLINPATAAVTSAALGVPVAAVPFVKSYGDPKKRGDWGLMARWTPAALGGATTFGAYYRKYTDKLPQLVLGGIQASTLPAYPNVVPTSFGLSYRDARATLAGASVTTQIAGLSVSGELTHRSNTNLLMGDATFVGAEPVGDTWHALVNAIAFIGKTPVFDSAALTTELSYSRIDKVKQNAGNFRAFGYDAVSCPTADTLGCATKDAWGLAVKFEPTWFQVFGGADLSMPIVVTDGIKGTSSVLFGGYEGNGSYSVGLSLSVKEKYSVALAYNDSFAKHHVGPNAQLGGAPSVTGVGGIGAQWDRGWLSLTFKTTF
ncbi:DUF1302 domain-containing protein [Pelomonas sp. KK5]|uniref:DUF1302 domain-containing protein n=1 Tax=Pelomonas sp. KK5 TaxID=1855730 RepID=UPI00097C3CA6|nr:DUF1302 domain-containing protein [Pelomonas sp. KK5]